VVPFVRPTLAAAALTTARPPPPPPPPPTRGLAAEFTTLRILRDRRIITPAEYDSALRDLGNTDGARGGDSLTFVLGRWSTTMYGFVETDVIVDSTQSLNDLAGNGLIARPGTYAGEHPRTMFGVRHSRIGFRLRAPEFHGIRASAMLEMDFLGNQPPSSTEAAIFTNPAFRVRHFLLRIETPIVDVLVGQFWHLFGGQPAYFPSTVQIQGVVGEVYGRTPQVRISRTLRTDAVNVEIAVAATRPPERDSAMPEGEAGLRLSVNRWTGVQTVGATGTAVAPFSIAVTGDVRRISVPEFSATPRNSADATGWGVAAGTFIPLVPGRVERRNNALAIHAEFAYGVGTADLYTGLNGGVSSPALPNPTSATPPPTYASNLDPGIATFTADGTLHLVQWLSTVVGVQYYLPVFDGRVWLSANYARMQSSNSAQLGATTQPRVAIDWFDVNVFGDVLPAVRLGLEYALTADHYADQVNAFNHRVQFAAFYLF
jgi:hypothetical protein